MQRRLRRCNSLPVEGSNFGPLGYVGCNRVQHCDHSYCDLVVLGLSVPKALLGGGADGGYRTGTLPSTDNR